MSFFTRFKLSWVIQFKIQIVLENDMFLLNYKPLSLGPWSTQQNAASRMGLGLQWKRSRLDISVYTRFPRTRRLSWACLLCSSSDTCFPHPAHDLGNISLLQRFLGLIYCIRQWLCPVLQYSCTETTATTTTTINTIPARYTIRNSFTCKKWQF